MIPVRAIRCVHCPRPVHPTRGGAYCVVHTPLDLTGGVAPGDRPSLTMDSKGRLAVPRMLPGEPEARLISAGWVRVEPERGGFVRWRDPVTGITRARDHAVRLAMRSQLAEMHRVAS